MFKSPPRLPPFFKEPFFQERLPEYEKKVKWKNGDTLYKYYTRILMEMTIDDNIAAGAAIKKKEEPYFYVDPHDNPF